MRAAEIAAALGGRKVGSRWMARCPAHGDRVPSLSARDAPDGKVLVYCHAGCEQTQVIAALRDHGLWPTSDRSYGKIIRAQPRHLADSQYDPKKTERTEAALAIWRSSIPAPGTMVETYLQSRGIKSALPPTLRFHSGLRHPSGGVWPAMVALVTRGNDGTRVAVHRTFLGIDGRGKAPVDAEKMMLGPCRGGSVRLGPTGDVLMVGEGIETCLSAMQASGRTAWAALSTSGLRTLELPREIRDVIVLADGDEPGEAAALECARRWRRDERRLQ
jgi:putative DNA primase/helicase